MDQELTRLRRNLFKDPENGLVAERYREFLLRAGNCHRLPLICNEESIHTFLNVVEVALSESNFNNLEQLGIAASVKEALWNAAGHGNKWEPSSTIGVFWKCSSDFLRLV